MSWPESGSSGWVGERRTKTGGAVRAVQEASRGSRGGSKEAVSEEAEVGSGCSWKASTKAESKRRAVCSGMGWGEVEWMLTYSRTPNHRTIGSHVHMNASPVRIGDDVVVGEEEDDDDEPFNVEDRTHCN